MNKKINMKSRRYGLTRMRPFRNKYALRIFFIKNRAYFPPKFDETRQYQAIVVSHPGGGVKEQTAGTYAKKLAEKGFVTIAYDAR